MKTAHLLAQSPGLDLRTRVSCLLSGFLSTVISLPASAAN